MNSEIMNSNGELDARQLFNKVQSLNSQLGELQKEAEDANIMPTRNVSGAWIFKTEHINPDKIELLGKNAYAQALVLSELYEIQMQAMQLSVGSFDALKTVNEELTKAMKIGFSESGAQNQQLFSKTQEQIKRIAVFAKNYADNLNELKRELSKDLEEDLSKYAEADDVERQIKDSLKSYVNNKDFEKYQKDIENNIQNVIENYVEKDEIDGLQKNLQIKIDTVKESLSHIEEFVKNIDERVKVSSKRKNNILAIVGLIFGLVGTVLALVSILILII